jgi:choline dehydrogenase-like flavoprotein
MIVSIEGIPAERRFDVCIAGSGPAGMSLALALAEKGKDVLLLEGGGAEFSDRSQDLYIGENRGDPYAALDDARLRFLGGSSNHWGGRCRPLDAIDFAYKDYCPEAHWPIDQLDLDPYLARAQDILDVKGDFADEVLDPAIRRLTFLYSEPTTRFADKYAATLRDSPRIVVALKTSLVGVEIEGDRVSGFRVRDFAGHQRTVGADTFVLACGGIENSRLLLHFNAECEGRLVPEARTLGRYWMEHPHFRVGWMALTSAFPNRLPFRGPFFGLTPERMRELGVLNCSLQAGAPTSGKGMRKLAAELACIAPRLGEWVIQQTGREFICDGRRIHASWEEEPKFDSHIALSGTQRDAFGIPRVELHWRKSARDIETVRKTVIELGSLLARQKLGRVRLSDWVLEDGPWPENDDFGGNHHMGGTRMSTSATDGIVTPDLRLWDMDNMYVAGSSVFPSGGHANPTLTIVQMSLRLADHLSPAESAAAR